jgi:cytochrome c biogenesis protein CcmG, thiol:disulfide interchange protein DsbE
MAGKAQNYRIPSVEIMEMTGGKFNTSDIKNEGPIIISFWATWCKPCVAELSALAEEYEELQEETGVKIVAISIDDVRNLAKVPAFVNGKAWEFDVYCDPNGDFKRALSVNTVPHTFLVDRSGNIVWQHNTYNPGDETELFSLVKKLARGESVQ